MSFQISASGVLPLASLVVAFAALSHSAGAATLCVNPAGSGGCHSTIQSAVNAAAPNDVINVRHGTYKEDVTIGKPLSLLGDEPDETIIDATGLADGIFIDGLHNPGLRSVVISGFTVKNANFEGVLIVNAADITISDNHILNNDKIGPVFSGAATGCLGQPAFETDETGDCGGGLHLIGTADSVVSDNRITGNADGILLSDETSPTTGNLILHNEVRNNAAECGIVLASHAPVGSTGPHFAPHFGISHNTIAGNVSAENGVTVGGAGVGLFSDGNGPGTVSNNVIIHNTLIGNGIGGVSLHTHVGPAYHAPADNLSGNSIIGNVIARNLADANDTATPGRVGININSGGGGSPVFNTVITQNVITDEDVDIAINTPAPVDIHLNDLRDAKIGIADVCAFDGAHICTGTIDATENYWGCAAGPGAAGCSTASGAIINYTPWLREPIEDQ